MSIFLALLFGVCGTLAMQVSEILISLQRNKQLPWKVEGESPLGVWIGITCCLIVLSVFVITLLHAMGQINSPWAAFITGIGADKFMENAIKQARSGEAQKQEREGVV